MVMVQRPDSTEYDGMPCSAIATGLVDYELPPADMAAQHISYVGHAFGKSSRHTAAPEAIAETTLKKIFVLLRNASNHDFSQYEPSTIHRRVERRMAVLEDLVPKEATVQTTAGEWFNMRIQPYRTLDNVIEGAVLTFVNVSEMKKAQEALQEAFDHIKQLRGIIPICSNCKSVRDDEGFWKQVEVYVRDHSEAEFSHSLCPVCIKKLYPEFEDDTGGDSAPQPSGTTA